MRRAIKFRDKLPPTDGNRREIVIMCGRGYNFPLPKSIGKLQTGDVFSFEVMAKPVKSVRCCMTDIG